MVDIQVAITVWTGHKYRHLQNMHYDEKAQQLALHATTKCGVPSKFVDGFTFSARMAVPGVARWGCKSTEGFPVKP
jgi:hypothetical protein